MTTNRHLLAEHFLQPWRQVAILLAGYDLLVICFSYFLALFLRFDCRISLIPENYLGIYARSMVFYPALFVLINWRFGLYRGIWQFASYHELLNCGVATLVTIPLYVLMVSIGFGRMPISYYVFGGVFQTCLILVSRFSYRIFVLEASRLLKRHRGGERQPVSQAMLIGAGEAGRMILRDLMTSHRIDTRVRCIIDDDPNKKGREMDGVPIVGGRDDILASVRKYGVDRIFYAIPTAPSADRKAILNICQESGCRVKVLPGLYQLVNGERINVDLMHDVAIEDLLGRDQISLDMDGIFRHLTGRVILITGGGGSIGSEICRQIAAHHPRKLVVFDIYENNAYDIQQELRRRHPDLDLEVLIGSVRDAARIREVLEAHRPEIVFHAAAHKHVPLMEGSPREAIKNNVLGTYKTAFAAMAAGCRRFVLISTDKAVNPTNVMGASKRFCEMLIQVMNRVSLDRRYDMLPLLDDQVPPAAVPGGAIFDRARSLPPTEFVAVRFGNVLGSNGSVIPLFKKQIAEGGPVTVTHPDIIRYFMTIPEAVSLVLQAGTYARGGEIFVLDMGEPVRIDALARNLIRLSGLKPDADIQIEYTGLRPGEKLYEEKLMAEEGLRKTPNHLIHIARPLDIDDARFLSQLGEMARLIRQGSQYQQDVFRLMEEATGTYHPQTKQ